MIHARTDLHAVLVTAFVAAVAPVAHAESARSSLVVTRGEGAEDCPNADELTARVRAMARHDMVDPAASEAVETWVQVELVRDFSGYRATIAARGRRQGTRSIEDVGPGCKSLGDAVAITLVMLLDPDVQKEPKPAPAIPPPVAAPAPAVTLPSPRKERAKAPSKHGTKVVVGAEASLGASLRVLEHAVPLAEGGARLGLGTFVVLGVGFGALLPDRKLAPGGSVDLQLAYGYARGCGRVPVSEQSELSLCGEPLLGSLSGTGRGYTTFETRRLTWLALAGALELRAALSRSLWWHARALTLFPLIEQGFSVSTAGVVNRAFATPPVGGMLSVGIGVEI